MDTKQIAKDFNATVEKVISEVMAEQGIETSVKLNLVRNTIDNWVAFHEILEDIHLEQSQKRNEGAITKWQIKEA